MPDNELEAAKGLHVEDIDCRLVVRPTRTALDLTFFGEVRVRHSIKFVAVDRFLDLDYCHDSATTLGCTSCPVKVVISRRCLQLVP